MKAFFIWIILTLFLYYFLVNVHGKKNKSKNKNSIQNLDTLQKIATNLEKCVIMDKTISKNKVPSQFRKCLKETKKKKSLSKGKKKTTKSFLKKFINSISKCIKSKNKKNKKNSKKKKRQKRSKNFAEEMRRIDEEMKKINSRLQKISNHKDLEACSREKCECGRVEYSSNARIFNGKAAFEKQFPWQILIQVAYINDKDQKKTSRSGGSLISRKHVLTVAHAFYELEDDSRKIQKFEGLAIGGIIDTNDLEKSGSVNLQTIKFSEDHIEIHKGYAPAPGEDLCLSFFDLDIALVRLPKLLEFNEYVKPICLPTNKVKAIDEIKKLDEKTLIISGFGWTLETQTSPTKNLQFAKVVKQNSDQCFKDVCKKDFPPRWETMKTDGFCMRGKNSEIHCIGDSGGPMLWQDKDDSDRAYLVGILSQMHGKCQDPTKYSVATYVSGKIFKWIMENEGTGKEINDCLVGGEITKETEIL